MPPNQPGSDFGPDFNLDFGPNISGAGASTAIFEEVEVSLGLDLIVPLGAPQ